MLSKHEEIAKDFVSSFIVSGKIKSEYDAVQSYFDIVAMLNNATGTNHLPRTNKPEEPYDPFKGL